jgi:hypothetical protein
VDLNIDCDRGTRLATCAGYEHVVTVITTGGHYPAEDEERCSSKENEEKDSPSLATFEGHVTACTSLKQRNLIDVFWARLRILNRTHYSKQITVLFPTQTHDILFTNSGRS